MSETIESAPINVPEEALRDLRERLARTRWPERETVLDWSQGSPLGRVRALCEHWQNRYDWRRCETLLNGLNPQLTTIDGLGIHFLHVASPEPNALPVVMTHGWPGSVLEFRDVIGPLTDPRSHGGDPSDALTLVLPSLPGYAFSDKPTAAGWTAKRVAAAWTTLMGRLGYGDRWGAQGGDWGAAIALALATAKPTGLVGCHFNLGILTPTPEEAANADPHEQAMLDRRMLFDAEQSGYRKEQSTRPQTIGYGLADSPAGQAAWIYEKLAEWSDCDGAPEQLFGIDAMLDNISLYWLTNSAASSARLYWESHGGGGDRPINLPTAFSIFPQETLRLSRRWAERVFTDIRHWSEPEQGGHFAAWEQPDRFATDVLAAFRKIQDPSSIVRERMPTSG